MGISDVMVSYRTSFTWLGREEKKLTNACWSAFFVGAHGSEKVTPCFAEKKLRVLSHSKRISHS